MAKQNEEKLSTFNLQFSIFPLLLPIANILRRPTTCG